MAKQWRTFEHTADVGLAADADTPEELFEAMAEGLAEFLCPPAGVRPREARTVTTNAEDVENLLHDFLSDVLGVMQTGRFMVASVQVKRLLTAGSEVVAELRGEPYDPARHELHMEVKAVTYHQLKVARQGAAWTGRVILDI